MNLSIKTVLPVTDELFPSIKLFQTKKNDDDENVTHNLNRITAKLKAGKRLTAEEKAFLMKHSPALYQTARRIELQREALEEQLKHAKSKEEANEIIGNALGGVSKKDPDAQYIIAAYQDEAKEFKESKAYSKLPDTKEEAKKAGKVNTYEPDRKEKEAEKTGLYGRDGMFM